MYPPPTHDSWPASFLRATNPGYSYCLRCGTPWSNVKEHSTSYSSSQGCFPLCEPCWQMLGSPEARIEYYKILIDWWNSERNNINPVSESEVRAIQRAVANGG